MFLVSNIVISVQRFLLSTISVILFLPIKNVCIELTECNYPGAKSVQLKIQLS